MLQRTDWKQILAFTDFMLFESIDEIWAQPECIGLFAYILLPVSDNLINLVYILLLKYWF